MGRSPCCDDVGLKKGPWTAEEDDKLREFIKENGHGSWRALPKHAGLNRCGKSCRLRWTNYLRPDIKRGKFSEDEERRIVELHSVRGNKWSEIARHLPGRTDNEIKNYWNTHLRKRLLQKGIDPMTHRPRADLALLASIPSLIAAASLGSIDPVESAMRLHDATQLAKIQLLNNLVQVLTTTAPDSYQINEPSRQLAQLQYPDSNPLGTIAFPGSFDANHVSNISGSGSSDLMTGFLPEICNNTSNYHDNYTDQTSNPTAENVFGTVTTAHNFDVPTSSNSSGYDLWGETFSYGDDFELKGFIEQYLR